MKREKKVISGVNISDYGFDPNRVIEDVKKYGDGKIFRWCPIRCDQGDISIELWREYARYFKEKGIYFTIHNSSRGINLPEGKKSHLTKEVVKDIQDIAGKYFLGTAIAEFGSYYASKAKGYRRGMSEYALKNSKYGINPIQGLKDQQEAKDTYIRQITDLIEINKELEISTTIALEAVTLFEYDFEAGADFLLVELVPKNMEQILNFARGAQRAFQKEELAAWHAHEFYGGYRMEDPLKAKRFTLEYLASYIGGVDFICLESGFHEIHDHGFNLSEDHPLTQSYLREAQNFADFCEKDKRPENGPICKVAFVKGNLDGFGWGNSSSLWGQYYDEKWGFSAPEHSYRILDEVYKTLPWHDAKNFGDYDYSHAPAYGQYDVVPICAPLEVLEQYDWLIFCGWNTMTEELYAKIKEYTKNGGNVLITAAHMRDSIERGKAGEFVCGGDFEDYIGCKLTGEKIRSNDGYKFEYESTIDGILYPGPPGFRCDPCWSGGYVNYEKIEPTTAKTVCYLADSFRNDADFMYPIMTENQYGKGNVIFMATSDYPGDAAVFPLYKIVVKEILTSTHRISDIKVICGEKVRFAVFENDNIYKVYLLNTDYNFEQKAMVMYKGKKIEKTISSVGIETVELEK